MRQEPNDLEILSRGELLALVSIDSRRTVPTIGDFVNEVKRESNSNIAWGRRIGYLSIFHLGDGEGRRRTCEAIDRLAPQFGVQIHRRFAPKTALPEPTEQTATSA